MKRRQGKLGGEEKQEEKEDEKQTVLPHHPSICIAGLHEPPLSHDT
jgi:hypothetical protein